MGSCRSGAHYLCSMAYACILALKGSWDCVGRSVTELTRGCPASWGMHRELIVFHCKKLACYEMLHRASDTAGCCEHCNET